MTMAMSTSIKAGLPIVKENGMTKFTIFSGKEV